MDFSGCVVCQLVEQRVLTCRSGLCPTKNKFLKILSRTAFGQYIQKSTSITSTSQGVPSTTADHDKLANSNPAKMIVTDCPVSSQNAIRSDPIILPLFDPNTSMRQDSVKSVSEYASMGEIPRPKDADLPSVQQRHRHLH